MCVFCLCSMCDVVWLVLVVLSFECVLIHVSVWFLSELLCDAVRFGCLNGFVCLWACLCLIACLV